MGIVTQPLTTEEVLASITDESAKAQGYPNAEIFRLEYQLGSIAGEWRHTHRPDLVDDYHRLFNNFISGGGDPDLLALENTLPDELMPTLSESKAKVEMVRRVVSEVGISQNEAQKSVDVVLEVIADFLPEGNDAVLPVSSRLEVRRKSLSSHSDF